MQTITCDCCGKTFIPEKDKVYLVRVNPKHTCESYNTRQVAEFDLCGKCLKKVTKFINSRE